MKKSPSYMNLSGWLPIPWSHWCNFQSQWVGSYGLNSDQFYNALKMIADDLNDNRSKKTIANNISNYLKDENIKVRNGFIKMFIEESYTFVYECFKIDEIYQSAAFEKVKY